MLKPAEYQHVTGCTCQYMPATEAKRRLSAMTDRRNPSHCHHIHPACNDGRHNGQRLCTLFLQALHNTTSKLILVSDKMAIEI